jgi:hypothetical protein
MKRLAILAFCGAGLASAADLSEVHNVYLLKMSKGFDQYLANHLTGGKIFQVVTDPKLADTVITEQIGEGFQAKLDELYPPPEVEKPEKPAKPEQSAKPEQPAKNDKSKKVEETETVANAGLMTDTVNKLASPATSSSFGRAKGMVFLVDAKTKQVIWSSYEVPKDTTSKQLDRTASEIVSRIRHDLKKK